jgi:hypothetical protein
MDYEKIYLNITNNAKPRKKAKGLENHHIVPSSCGGSNDKSNRVYLTTREHLICHLLLVKIYKHNPVFRKKMIYALWWMIKTRNKISGVRVTSHAYASARKQFSEENPNKCVERKKKFIENHKAGVYHYDYSRVSETLKDTLGKLSKEQMSARMKASALSGDQEKRRHSIKKGKASHFLLITKDGVNITFWSYDDVPNITGYKYDQILYRIKKYNGVLPNGAVVRYITKYRGNDGNIGKIRNISI